MVVAIDGPAGAGKSSVARAVAAALGFTYLDSGRDVPRVALAARAAARPAGGGGDAAARSSSATGCMLDGEDVTEAIRTPEVSEAGLARRGRPRGARRRWSPSSGGC